MKRILLTGGTGFVGSNLARHMLLQGHRVTLLVRPQADLWRIADIQRELDIRTVSMEDFTALQPVVRDAAPDWIFHLAVHGAYSWQKDWAAMINTNLLATANLLEAAADRGFDAFINTGSSSEYGFVDQAAEETLALHPNSYYAVTKAAATMACQHVAKQRSMHIPTLRLYSVYGPYEDPNRLMPTIALKALNKQLPPLVDPETARDYVYIDDVIEAYKLAAQIKTTEFGAVYNIGSGIQTNIRQVVETVKRVLPVHEEPKWGSMENRVWDSNVWQSDPSKAFNELGWKAAHSFESGFRKMVSWFQEDPARIELYHARRGELCGATRV